MSRFADLLKQAEGAHLSKGEATAPSSVVGNKSGHKWSPQQEEFLAAHHPKMLLTALAGSGKTSLLMEYAKRRPHQKWNFLVFNRALADVQSASAPKNVVVKTAHQLAFAKFGADLQHKLRPVVDEQSLISECAVLGARHWPQQARRLYLRSLRQGLEHYLHSPIPQIDFALCPTEIWGQLCSLHADISWEKSQWTKDLQELWRMSLDPHSPIPITHDVYLKRFCLMEHQWDGQNWMLDEAQDCAPSLQHAFVRNTRVSVRVGDPFQSLYHHNKSSSWVQPHEQQWWLTQSFRSSASLAPWINARLSLLGCTHLWTGNPQAKTCHIEQTIHSAHHLVAFAPNVLLASRWEDLQSVAKELAAHQIPHRWHPNSPYATSCENTSSSTSAVLLSTIHSAKGLEFDRVWLHDRLLASDDSWDQQQRLAYVALSRARCAIRVPPHFPPPHGKTAMFAEDEQEMMDFVHKKG